MMLGHEWLTVMPGCKYPATPTWHNRTISIQGDDLITCYLILKNVDILVFHIFSTPSGPENLQQITPHNFSSRVNQETKKTTKAHSKYY